MINNNNPLPVFQAYLSAYVANVTGDGTFVTVPYDLAIDTTSSFNTTTHIFTAPVAGNYYLQANVQAYNINASHRKGLIGIATTPQTFYLVNNPAAIRSLPGVGDAASLFVDCIVSLAAGNTAYVTFNVFLGTKTVYIDAQAIGRDTWFAGYLIR
jgi:hypothetical protein